jgi:hypothetical protein
MYLTLLILLAALPEQNNSNETNYLAQGLGDPPHIETNSGLGALPKPGRVAAHG